MRSIWRYARYAVGLLAAAAGVATLILAGRVPSNDRDWAEDLARLARPELLPDGAVEMRDVRDWRYLGDSVIARDYFDARYDPDDVTGLWFYEVDLDDRGLTAHTFLVFEFDESYGERRWLAFSVEARREANEEYSLVGGVMRKFEVAYVWGSEEDVVTRRTEFYDSPLIRYHVAAVPDRLPAVFRQFVTATIALEATPRWYNTLTTNCTSLLVDVVNAERPGAIPWHYSEVLTGKADTYLARLGYLDLDAARTIDRAWLGAHPLR